MTAMTMKLAEFQTLMYICQIMHWLVFCQLVRDWDHLKGEKWNLKKMPLSGWCTGKSVGYLTSWPERRGFWNLRQLVIFHSRPGSREMDASAELIFSLLLQCRPLPTEWSHLYLRQIFQAQLFHLETPSQMWPDVFQETLAHVKLTVLTTTSSP